MDKGEDIIGPTLEGCGDFAVASTYSSIVEDDNFTSGSKAVEQKWVPEVTYKSISGCFSGMNRIFECLHVTAEVAV
jgi:hypothetical protein